jgi:hypothetical protein
MLRFSEIGLFLVPFALYATWLVLGRRTPPLLVWGALALTLAMGVGTVWFGLANRLGRNESYVPAAVVDGHLVPGHGVAPSQPRRPLL